VDAEAVDAEEVDARDVVADAEEAAERHAARPSRLALRVSVKDSLHVPTKTAENACQGN
jgi:pyruvate-formate lyase